MKKSLTHLPKNKREELKTIVGYVLEELTNCEMIILYGSYARGDYVDYDQRNEFGIRTFFMSDYDLLVLINNKVTKATAERRLEKVDECFSKGKHYSMVTPIQFIVECVSDFNRAIDKGRYFYTDIKKEGILLYDSGNCKLERRRKLNYSEIKEQAQEYFDEKFQRANSFLFDVHHAFDRKDFKQASFYLHQSIENFYLATILTFTLYTKKEHNLEKLAGSAKSHSLKTVEPFPRNTSEEKRLFKLLQQAYVQARYNPDFVVTKEDIEALIPKVEMLRDITKLVCEKEIGRYEELINSL